MFESLQFIRPLWLLLLPVVIYLWWLNHYHKASGSVWNAICDKAILDALLIDKNKAQGLFEYHHLIAMLGLLAILALAGPSWNKNPDNLLRSNAALFIAFDLSNSMLVHDVKPSRYIKARFKIEDLLNQHTKGDVALIAYASQAYPVTPLTHDVENIKALVPSLSPKIMPGRGSNLQAVLDLSKELLKRSNLKKGDVLLVTDGVGNDNLDELITYANASKLRISILGVGTEQGDFIPAMNDIDMLQKPDGSFIASKLDTESLEKLAKRTGGLFMQVRADANDIDRLSTFLNKADNQHRDSNEKGEIKPQDNGIWLVLLCLPLAILMFRKNVLFIVFLSVLSLPQSELQAADFYDWFRNNNQKAKEAFDKTEYRQSLRLFNDIRWQAASAYRLNDWQKAYDLYVQLDDTESIYNRGNTLVFLARLEEAIIAYNEVLRREPEHQDAKYNKEEVLKLLNKLSDGKENTGKSSSDEQANKNKQEKSDNNNDKQDKKDDKKPPAMAGKQAQSAQSSSNTDELPLENATTKPSDSDDANSAEVSDTERELQEDTLAKEQWLRRIKDDPAGLMRRKFREKYKQQGSGENYTGDPW